MTPSTVPAPLRDFILRHIHSIAEMEALVMMIKSPGTAWTVEATAARLYVHEDEAAEVLGRLARHGLAAREALGWRYACRSPEVAALAEALVALYAVQLIPVTHVIHSSRPARIQAFADAFQLRKKEP